MKFFKIQFYLMAALIAVIPSAGLFASSKKTVKTAVNSCMGKAAKCFALVNAIGDPITVDVTKYKVTDLGTITVEQTKKLILPKEIGIPTVFSVTPTTGESAGKLIHFLFLPTTERGRRAGMTIVKMARQFGKKPSKVWTELGDIETAAKPEELTEAEVLFKPDGTAVYDQESSEIDPATGKNKVEKVVFPLGQVKLTDDAPTGPTATGRTGSMQASRSLVAA